MSLKQDCNFDKLIDKFETRIYSSAKGAWRLKLLQEDLAELAAGPSLQIWDAGCGLAQIGLWLAEQGHQLTLCDISEKMLQRAEQSFLEAGLTAEFKHGSAQILAQTLAEFDLVLFHAVLEWLVEPVETLRMVAKKVAPGGWLSLLFYNRNAMVYTNALKGAWRMQHLLQDSYLGKGKKLTPPNPQYPHEILSVLNELGFEVMQHTGIRVFYDYLPPEALQKTQIQELFDLEYRYCRLPTYRDMGRYVHVLCKRTR